jgi:osmotically-inducible protein OsmY
MDSSMRRRASPTRLRVRTTTGHEPRQIPPTTRKTFMATVESTLDSLISSAIERSPHLKRRDLRFETHEGRVVLRGTVSSYYQKQMAQETLRRLKGVDHIENHLEVNWV